jgi:hypothetical protein
MLFEMLLLASMRSQFSQSTDQEGDIWTIF